MINPGRRWTRAAMLLAVLIAPGALAGCDEFLQVENPAAIETPQLNNPAYIGLLVNGVIGEFQHPFSVAAYRNGVFTDELRNHHGFSEEILWDQRNVTSGSGTYSFFLYNPLHRARFLADSSAVYIRGFLADSASRSISLARVQAYGGYTYVLLGEALCESPINGQPRRYSSEELLRDFALPRFDEAIAVATAARAHAAAITPATTASRAAVADADSIANLARVGAARAALNLGDKTKAIQYASQVTNPNFTFWAVYSTEGYTRGTNEVWTRLTAGTPWASLDETPFESITNDPRVPRPATTQPVISGREFVPNSSRSYTTYTGTMVGGEFARNSGLRMASYIEAQYILAEAQGLTPANLTFLNAQRAIGGQAPLVAPTQAGYMAALREQRRREFYLDTHRLGDLRRYKKLYGIDEFPKGLYPGSTTEEYGDQECYPLTAGEIAGNPGS